MLTCAISPPTSFKVRMIVVAYERKQPPQPSFQKAWALFWLVNMIAEASPWCVPSHQS